MGQAAARGTFEQRKALAIKARAEQGVEAMVDSIDAADAILANSIKRGPSKSTLMGMLMSKSIGL
jgi:hypothetical protein|tara:strand:- start:231 stop:425 length:195 start_codon:yes stop_codon:yes gene_type:complete